MYSVRLGYDTARRRIDRLLQNGHKAEALVAAVATVEKTLRRTLVQIVVSAGFTREDAEKLVRQMRSFDSIKQHWSLFDPHNRNLVDVIGNQNWQVVKKVAQMRNNLVHGKEVYQLSTCDRETGNILSALDEIRQALCDTYECDGWERLKGRATHKLHIDPKIKT